MNMEPQYWIVDSAIIFKPSFNECLDDYIDIMSNCRILIFSNYNDPHIALKNNNSCYHNDNDSYIESSFDQCLDNLLNLKNLEQLYLGVNFRSSLNNSLLNLTNLKKLILSLRFDKPLDNSLSNLINLSELTFGSWFNQPLGDSLLNLINLRILKFGWFFNQPLGNLLSNLHNLRELSLGKDFNQPIDIPDGIKKLTIGCNCPHIIDYLPSGIEELVLGLDFNSELDNLPSSIKKIKITNINFNKKLNNLPNQIETLEIKPNYKVRIDRKYKNLNVVYF